jgi:hypothetical protein
MYDCIIIKTRPSSRGDDCSSDEEDMGWLHRVKERRSSGSARSSVDADVGSPMNIDE